MSTNLFSGFEKNIARAQRLQLYPIVIEKAYGEYLEDVDGNIYLDLLAGSSVANLGYGNSEILEAYNSAARQVAYTNFHYTPTRAAIELSEKLFELAPGNYKKKILFGLSGSDAVEAAIKSVQSSTGRKLIVNFSNAYHGAHFLSYLASDFVNTSTAFGLKARFIRTLAFPKAAEESLAILDKLQELLRTKKIAGVLLEPIQGDGGNIVPPEAFLPAVRELCTQYDTPLIIDEVLTGAGRSGKWFAIEYEKVIPDLVVVGKGFGCGYVPFSAVIGEAGILDSLPKGSHVSSYFGHSSACSVVLKVIELIERGGVLGKCSENGEYFRSLAKKRFTSKKILGRGWINAIEGRIPGYEFGKLVGVAALKEGAYCGYFGAKNNTLRVHPPLTLSKKQVESAVDILERAMLFAEGELTEKLKCEYSGCSGFDTST